MMQNTAVLKGFSFQEKSAPFMPLPWPEAPGLLILFAYFKTAASDS
jgi:hypothetical protein